MLIAEVIENFTVQISTFTSAFSLQHSAFHDHHVQLPDGGGHTPINWRKTMT